MRRCDPDDASFLLYLIFFCGEAVLFTFREGGEVMFYAGFPMLCAAAVSCFCSFSMESFAARQVRLRMERRKYSNALVCYRCAVKTAWVFAAAFLVLFLVFSGVWGSVLGYPMTAPVFRIFAAGICLSPFAGCLRGFLRGIGRERSARISLWAQSALFPVLGTAAGIYGSVAGGKVGVLLRNDGIRAVYCACGIGTGFSLSVLAVVLYLLILCSLAAGRIRHERDSMEEDILTLSDPMEDERELFRYYRKNLFPSAAVPVICMTGFLVGYRLWLNGQDNTRNLVISRWGGFMGVGFPVVTGCALICAMPFTALCRSLVRDAEAVRREEKRKGSSSRAEIQNRRKTLISRLALMLRLSAYVGIPCSGILFGAAKEIAGLFPNLTFRAGECAVLTLKAGSFLVFLLSTGILITVWLWRAKAQRIILISLSGGLFAQIVFLVILNLCGVGITLTAWSADLSAAVYLVLLWCFGKTDLLRGMRLSSWMTDDALIFLCSVIALIPVLLLNDYLLLVMNAAAALAAELVLFYSLFILVSILLRAADLRNIRRIPGGGLVYSVAVLLGAAEQEQG